METYIYLLYEVYGQSPPKLFMSMPWRHMWQQSVVFFILKLASVLKWSASHSGPFTPRKSAPRYPPKTRLLSCNILHTEHIVLAAALRASDRQQSGDIIPHAVIQSIVLLRMGKELPETCRANLKINKLLLLHLVGHLLDLCLRCAVKHTSKTSINCPARTYNIWTLNLVAHKVTVMVYSFNVLHGLSVPTWHWQDDDVTLDSRYVSWTCHALSLTASRWEHFFVISLEVSVGCRARKENTVCKLLLPDVDMSRRIITFRTQIKAYINPLPVYLSPMIQL